MKAFAAIGSSVGLSLVLCACTATEDASVSGTAALSGDRQASTDAGAGGDDGTPTRVPCTNSFGAGLSGTFGRIDGTIAAVVPPGHGACSADRHHVHLQISSQGQIYDVAVNTDGGFIAERQAPLPGGPWSEGWHRGGSLDYPTDLGLHSSDFTAGSEAELDAQLESALANANHVSVFATLYSHSGVHLVHRRGNGVDGALILDPLSPNARVFAFHFDTQSF
jgi:hypothetical protein